MLNENKIKQIYNIRREYNKKSLRRRDLPSEPFKLFKIWLKQACQSDITDPTAMVIATVNDFGQPYQRTVLLKYYNNNGLFFYTNLNSRKVNHLKNNPFVSLLFPWYVLERQIIITGKAQRLSTLEVKKYFYSRPRESQISSWVSNQSSYIKTRKILEDNFFKFKQKFKEKKIPLPNFWGGFSISIEQIEFWQGGKYRLHDRFLYKKNNEIWEIYRLSP